jgi:hypothetical protein
MDDIFKSLTNLELLTLLLYGEARGEGLDGMLAVASVVMNRVAVGTGSSRPCWWGKDIKSVILKPQQFSCFNEDDPNCELLEEFAQAWEIVGEVTSPLRTAYWIAKGVLDKYLESNVSVATHYHANGMMVIPEWARKMKMVCNRGNHVFYV